MSFKEKAAKIGNAICKILIYCIIFVLGAAACKYLAPDYQIGSAAKLDSCEELLARDINCVLVAVEGER